MFVPVGEQSFFFNSAQAKLVDAVDMVEDVMQQSLPKFVEAIRISDVGQGVNPFRIVSMRALPDQPGEKEYPREEWIDQGTNQLLEDAKKSTGKQDMEQSGDYVVCRQSCVII